MPGSPEGHVDGRDLALADGDRQTGRAPVAAGVEGHPPLPLRDAFHAKEAGGRGREPANVDRDPVLAPSDPHPRPPHPAPALVHDPEIDRPAAPEHDRDRAFGSELLRFRPGQAARRKTGGADRQVCRGPRAGRR